RRREDATRSGRGARSRRSLRDDARAGLQIDPREVRSRLLADAARSGVPLLEIASRELLVSSRDVDPRGETRVGARPTRDFSCPYARDNSSTSVAGVTGLVTCSSK